MSRAIPYLSQDIPWRANIQVTGTVYVISTDDTDTNKKYLYVGGAITAVVDAFGVSQSVTGLCRFFRNSGRLDTLWNPNLSGGAATAYCLEFGTGVTAGYVYVGGSFTSCADFGRRSIAVVSTATGADSLNNTAALIPAAGFTSSAGDTIPVVMAIKKSEHTGASAGTLFIGGFFNTSAYAPATHIYFYQTGGLNTLQASGFTSKGQGQNSYCRGFSFYDAGGGVDHIIAIGDQETFTDPATRYGITGQVISSSDRHGQTMGSDPGSIYDIKRLSAKGATPAVFYVCGTFTSMASGTDKGIDLLDYTNSAKSGTFSPAVLKTSSSPSIYKMHYSEKGHFYFCGDYTHVNTSVAQSYASMVDKTSGALKNIKATGGANQYFNAINTGTDIRAIHKIGNWVYIGGAFSKTMRKYGDTDGQAKTNICQAHYLTGFSR